MHRMKSSLMLLGVGLAVMLALFVASGGTKTEQASAGAADFNGVYDALVHDGTEAVGLFHCMANVNHNTGTEAVSANLVCYIDTPGLAPGNPLVDTANAVPGPVPPPPYGTAAPTTLTGTYAPIPDTLPLKGCFDNIGGTLGPNVIVDATLTNAGAELASGTITGTVDIYSNQSNANCALGTPEAGDAPFLNDQPLNLYTAASGNSAWRSPGVTNFDGDGCTDAQELTLPTPAACGDDPYNPNDSVTDFDGPISILATAIQADWNDTTEALIGGSYFHCLGYTDDNAGAITTTVQCYTDSPLLGGGSGSGVPGSGDGSPGAPNPRIGVRAATGFTTAAPTVNTGSVTGGNIDTLGCFADVGPPLGPNVITHAVIDATTGQGTVQIYFSQTNANCAAKTPQGTASLTAALEVASQDDTQDSDGDGCTDKNEVLNAAACGDDPYNKWDGDGLSDASLSGAYSLNFAPVLADIDGTENTGGDAGGANSCYDGIDNGGGDGIDGADPDDCNVIAGQYSNCIVDMSFSAGAMTGPSICYVDSATLGNAGDGLPGTPPPNAPDTDPTSFVNPVTTRRVITGTLTGSTLDTTQCFLNVDLPPTNDPAGNKDVGVVAAINAYTGHGSGDITLYNPNSTCTTGSSGVLLSGDIDVAPQGPRYTALPAASQNTANSVDTDKDGCRDDQETKGPGTGGTGGARDPYNRWDLDDQWIGGAKDRVISGGDIGVVVGRFGSVGSPTGDPLVPPTAISGYHVSADRNGSITGANTWNLKPPNGSISGGDIGAVVAQFGHTCTST